MQAVIRIGIQATGKSTLFRRRYADSHVRINLDMLRTRHREQAFLATCLNSVLAGEASIAEKNELVFVEAGTNFNDLPSWHKRGVGVLWETYDKPGVNPKTGEVAHAARRRLRTEFELPKKAAHSALVRDLRSVSLRASN